MMAVYSHSRLSTYENCPQKYKFKYVEKFNVGNRASVESFRGKMVHEALQRLYELVMEGKVWLEDELLKFYDKIWDKQNPGELFIKDEDLTEQDFRDKGRRMLSDYYRKYYPFDQEKTVALERNVVVDLDPEGKYRARGIIDRLAITGDGIMQIHDYKTARQMVKQQDLNEDRQLALYQLAVQQMWPDRDRFELVWHYLAVPEKRTSTRDDIQIEDLVANTIQLIREIEQAIEDDNFPTKESRLCNWCEYMPFCPAKIHPMAVDDMSVQELSSDEIVQAVDRYVELKQIIADLSNELEVIRHRLAENTTVDAVKVFGGTDKNVTVRTGSQYRPKYARLEEGKEAAKREFVQFLIETGMIDEVFNYNANSFDSFIKKAKFDPQYRDSLFKLIVSVKTHPAIRVTNKSV